MNSTTKNKLSTKTDSFVPAYLQSVRATNDYSIFKKLYVWRDLNPNTLRKLKKKIQKKNNLLYCPILVNKDFEVLNGQHRLAVAKELNLTVYYLVCEGLTVEHMMWMHTNQALGDIMFTLIMKSLFIENIKLADVN